MLNQKRTAVVLPKHTAPPSPAVAAGFFPTIKNNGLWQEVPIVSERYVRFGDQPRGRTCRTLKGITVTIIAVPFKISESESRQRDARMKRI